jgi:hypothetical protein
MRSGLTPGEYAGILFNNELDTQDVDPDDPFDADADVTRPHRHPLLQ